MRAPASPKIALAQLDAHWFNYLPVGAAVFVQKKPRRNNMWVRIFTVCFDLSRWRSDINQPHAGSSDQIWWIEEGVFLCAERERFILAGPYETSQLFLKVECHGNTAWDFRMQTHNQYRHRPHCEAIPFPPIYRTSINLMIANLIINNIAAHF